MQQNLLNLLGNSKDWEYGVSPTGLWLTSPSRADANLITDLYFEELVVTACKLGGKVQIYWGDRSQAPIEICDWMYSGKLQEIQEMTNFILPTGIQSVDTNANVASQPDEPSKLLWFANVAVSPILLTIANDLIENPRKAGVVRLSDELQVIMSDGCKILNPGHTVQEATNWRRSQFWHPQDLIDFRRECRQQLTPDGVTTLEFRWRSFDPDLGIDCSEPGNWLEFATRYRLFDGGDGDFYQICDNLGMREIEPVTV